MAPTDDARRSGAEPSGGSPFDGPLGPFLDAVVRVEDSLSRMLAPLARRVQQRPAPTSRDYRAA